VKKRTALAVLVALVLLLSACAPAYPTVNAAKERLAADSPLNFYFSTIDAGLTVHLEPEGDPDWGHYDSISTLKLGRLFGEYVAESYRMRG
jgi:hypothetical protein